MKEENKRNYGIDFLKILSIFFVILEHCYSCGGLINSFDLTGGNSIGSLTIIVVFAFIALFVVCAVNYFGIASGFVCYKINNKNNRFIKFILLWIDVVLYGVLICLIINIIDPSLVSPSDYIMQLFPLTNKVYWYFLAYTGVYIFMPFINKSIENSDNQSLKKLFILLIIFFSIFNTISKSLFLNEGYSFLWLFILYIIGAIIKKLDIGKNKSIKKLILMSLPLYIITIAYKLIGPEFSFLGISITKDLFLSYTSPTILGISILNFLIFTKLDFNDNIKKIISFIIPSVFSIYIINNHPIYYDKILPNLFISIMNYNVFIIFIITIVFALISFIISLLVDKIKILFFKKIGLTYK